MSQEISIRQSLRQASYTCAALPTGKLLTHAIATTMDLFESEKKKQQVLTQRAEQFLVTLI